MAVGQGDWTPGLGVDVLMLGRVVGAGVAVPGLVGVAVLGPVGVTVLGAAVGVALRLGVGPAGVGGCVLVGVFTCVGVSTGRVVDVLVAVTAGCGVDLGRIGGSVGVGARVLVARAVRVIVAIAVGVGVGVSVSCAIFTGRTNDLAAGEIIRLVMPRQ